MQKSDDVFVFQPSCNHFARPNLAFTALMIFLVASLARAQSVTMLSPADQSTVSGTITVSASIDSSVSYSSVAFWVDNWSQIGQNSSPQLVYNSAALSNGTHKFFISALNSSGGLIASSNIVVVNVKNGTTATMVSPAGGATISGTINISASVNSTNYSSIAFWIDNWTKIGQNSSSQLSYNTSGLSNGKHSFFVTVLDSSGAALAASNIVTADVENSAIPAVTMQSPSNGATVSGTIAVSTSVSSSVSGVTFYSDSWSNPIGSVSAPPYQISFSTTAVPNGSHTFWATAQDSAGSGASNIVAVTVQNLRNPTCSPVAPMTSVDQNGFDMLNAFNNTNTGASGPYFGAGNWKSSWYFLNLAYLGYVDLMQSTVKGYIAYYLQNTNADWSIEATPDSDDSFASTLLSLASAYYQVTCDQAFFASTVPNKGITILDALKNVATNNLVNATFPNGLVHVFQSSSASAIAYDEDNSEDYKGLEDFGNFLSSIGDSSASTYLNAAANIVSGMQQTYLENVWSGAPSSPNYLNMPGFMNAWQHDSAYTGPLGMQNPVAFYPDAVSQIFPQAYRVPVPSSMYAGGWNFLRSTFDFESGGVDAADPWMIIGLAAAYNGDNTTADAMRSKTRSWPGPPINNWGFYRRTVLYEKYGFIFGTPSGQPGPLPILPSNATAYSNLQLDSGQLQAWNICGTCAGSSGSGTGNLTFGNQSPSLSQASMAETSAGSFWNILGYRHLGCPNSDCAAVQNMLEDMWFDPATVSDVQQLEFDPDLFNAGYKYFASVACRLKGDNPNFWYLWNSAANTWEPTSYPCTALTIAPGTWHHFQLYATFDTSNRTYAYQTFVYDGVTVFQNLGQSYNALLCPMNSCSTSTVNIEQQIDNDGNNPTNTVYYDNYNLWVW